MHDRAETLVQLADLIAVFSNAPTVNESLIAEHVAPNIAVLSAFASHLDALPSWDKASIAQAIAQTLKDAGLKMPQLAIPVRVAVFGTTQTPGVDAMLAVLGKPQTMSRLHQVLT
jgi:glutamyl-tRNA synthetase